MGSRGPVPKRDSQRRRRNKKAGATTKGTASSAEPAKAATSRWHPIARRWFESLAESGQAEFYEPSDWAVAELLAEAMSRELKPKPIGVDDDGEPILVHQPITAAALSALLKGMTDLLVTEGARRRASLELERSREPAGEEGDGSVSYIDHARRRRGAK